MSTDFGRVAANSLLVRPHVPAHLVEAYDEITAAALKHVISEEVARVKMIPVGPLAPVVELHGYSRNVDGSA